MTLDLLLEDGDGMEVLQAMAKAKFTGSVIVVSGMNAARRIAARSYARSLGIELQACPSRSIWRRCGSALPTSARPPWACR